MSFDLRTRRSATTGPRRMRLEPIWLHAVWLFFGTGAAVAEIDRLDLERQPGRHVIAGAAAATDGGLWLLRRVEHLDARFEVESVSHTLTEISPTLEIERELALSEGNYGAVAAFKSGVLVAREFPPVAPSGSRRSARAAQVPAPAAQLRVVSAEPPFETTFYQWSQPVAAPFAAAPASPTAAASVYVIEYTGMSEPEHWTGALVKVSADGEVLWSWELSDSPIDVVATEQGALVLGWAPRAGSAASTERRRQTVTSLTADGTFAWREEFAFERYISELLLAEPAKLVLVSRGFAQAVLDLGSRSLEAFQQPAGGYTVSFFPISSHVAHGRLIRLHRAYEQPYLSIEDFGDVPPVTARFQLRAGSRINAVYPAYGGMVVLPLATNRLAVVAEWTDELPRAPGADLPELVPHSAVIATDVEARDLVAAYGTCLTGDVEELAAAEHRLREDFGVSVSLGTFMLAGRRPLDANGCELPSDADYARFMDELRAELTRRAARPWADTRLYVGVDAFDIPYRLQHYSSDSFAVHGLPGPSIGFVAHPNGAAALAAYIVDVVEPFHTEMNRLGNEFGTLTQRTLSASWNAGTGGTDDDLALSRLEQAAERIVAEARRLSPEEREALRQNREPLVFHFDDERFGVAADMKPLADARETLLDATRNQSRRRR